MAIACGSISIGTFALISIRADCSLFFLERRLLLSSAGMAAFVDVAGCPISTPPDDLCLYHCISFARDPELYASIPRSDLGHFIGDGAAAMTRRARSIRDELVALLRATGTLLVLCAQFEPASRGESFVLQHNRVGCAAEQNTRLCLPARIWRRCL